MKTEPVVTFKTLRSLKYCAASVKRWCDQHEIDIRRFRDGVPVSEIRATGCPMALAAADKAEQEA